MSEYDKGYRQALIDLLDEIKEDTFECETPEEVVETLEDYLTDNINALDNPEE